jgi:hypothetical protein
LLFWPSSTWARTAGDGGAAFHGALLGVLILIRPAAAAFLVLLPMLWVSLRLSWRHLGLLACGVVLVLAPWIVRNTRSVGVPALTTNLGPNLLIGNHPGATGGYAPEVPPEMLPRRGLEREEHAASRDAAIHYIAQDPGAFLWRGLRKLGYLASAEGEVVVYAFHENPTDPGTRFREKYRSVPVALHLAVSLPYALLTLLRAPPGRARERVPRVAFVLGAHPFHVFRGGPVSFPTHALHRPFRGGAGRGRVGSCAAPPGERLGRRAFRMGALDARLDLGDFGGRRGLEFPPEYLVGKQAIQADNDAGDRVASPSAEISPALQRNRLTGREKCSKFRAADDAGRVIATSTWRNSRRAPILPRIGRRLMKSKWLRETIRGF